jgi:hypothetical protein
MKNHILNPGKITDIQKQEYKNLEPLLTDVLREIKELSKKKQDGILNELKVKTINRILMRLKNLLADEPLNDFLDLLNEDSLPSNSDAVLIIVQFETALALFEKKHRNDLVYLNF